MLTFKRSNRVKKMTQQEKEDRREARKQATAIRNAYKRLAKKKPCREKFLQAGVVADLIRGPVYEISAEDYKTLLPLLETEMVQSFKLGKKDVEIRGTLFPHQHLEHGGKHYITTYACSEQEQAYYMYRLYKAVLFI
jgi:hypothetical protein